MSVKSYSVAGTTLTTTKTSGILASRHYRCSFWPQSHVWRCRSLSQIVALATIWEHLIGSLTLFASDCTFPDIPSPSQSHCRALSCHTLATRHDQHRSQVATLKPRRDYPGHFVDPIRLIQGYRLFFSHLYCLSPVPWTPAALSFHQTVAETHPLLLASSIPPWGLLPTHLYSWTSSSKELDIPAHCRTTWTSSIDLLSL